MQQDNPYKKIGDIYFNYWPKTFPTLPVAFVPYLEITFLNDKKSRPACSICFQPSRVSKSSWFSI